MLKTLLIIGLVLAVLIGGILALRSSARTGMPSDEVLKRASHRARELDAAEKESDDKP
jgi:uncharacterized membrane protein YciS (DUF1049 family)